MDTDQQTSTSSDQPTDPVLHQFDWTASESVSVAVVEAVAVLSDEAPTELPPLYDAIDPDALNAIVTDGASTSRQGRVDVTFPFNDYLVNISSAGDGYVSLRDPK